MGQVIGNRQGIGDAAARKGEALLILEPGLILDPRTNFGSLRNSPNDLFSSLVYSVATD